MFKVAGLAVAMGNAYEDVKREAQVTIRTNDEDGLVHYLSEFIA